MVFWQSSLVVVEPLGRTDVVAAAFRTSLSSVLECGVAGETLVLAALAPVGSP